MKIWINGEWCESAHAIFVIYLNEKDKENINNMHPDCNLYCIYDEEFKISYIKKLITRLKKEVGKK